VRRGKGGEKRRRKGKEKREKRRREKEVEDSRSSWRRSRDLLTLPTQGLLQEIIGT
jgi:hypothetical protein